MHAAHKDGLRPRSIPPITVHSGLLLPPSAVGQVMRQGRCVLYISQCIEDANYFLQSVNAAVSVMERSHSNDGTDTTCTREKLLDDVVTHN